MMGRTIENNKATVCGNIAEEFQYSHESHGEKFYTSAIVCSRKSGIIDHVPIAISEKLFDSSAAWSDQRVEVSGTFRSHDKKEGDRNRLVLFLFVDSFIPCDNGDKNEIHLDGFICMKPVYRETLHGYKIADIMIAVNRQYKKSDYIPCIAWGRNAIFANTLKIGDYISVDGRIQSREYQKQLKNGECETRTAYEVSLAKIDLIQENEEPRNEI